MAKSKPVTSISLRDSINKISHSNDTIQAKPSLADIVKSERETGSSDAAFNENLKQNDLENNNQPHSSKPIESSELNGSDNWQWEDYFVRSATTSGGIKTTPISLENSLLLKQLAVNNNSTVISLLNNILAEFKQKNAKRINKTFKSSLL